MMVQLVAAAWVASLAFDLFLHGGLLAKLYVAPSPFLLGPEEAFRRIPLGYLSFLILTASLYYWLRRLGVCGAVAAFRHGAVSGALLWGALAVGLYSISTATIPVLLAWWIGQTLELGLAGAVLGAGASGVPPKRLWAMVGGVVIACVVGTVLLQSFGLAPPMKRVR